MAADPDLEEPVLCRIFLTLSDIDGEAGLLLLQFFMLKSLASSST